MPLLNKGGHSKKNLYICRIMSQAFFFGGNWPSLPTLTNSKLTRTNQFDLVATPPVRSVLEPSQEKNWSHRYTSMCSIFDEYPLCLYPECQSLAVVAAVGKLP